MLAELKLELEADDPDFGHFQSSNLQGVLMERIDKSYASRLHEQGLNSKAGGTGYPYCRK